MTAVGRIRKKSSVLTVWKEIKTKFGEIGMVIPSSGSLARAMVRPMKSIPGPRRILEVGPGTGPMTREILKLMGPEDRFVICEINPQFLKRLKKDLVPDQNYQIHKDRVTFFEGPVQALGCSNVPGNYDFIVSSLPFLNFKGEEVENLFQLYYEMMSERGVLSTCEYVGIRRISMFVASPRHRERMKNVDQVLRKWREQARINGELKTKVSLLNMPPAYAVQYKYKEADSPKERKR